MPRCRHSTSTQRYPNKVAPMERTASPVPRKLVEAAFRRSWLLILPVVLVPAAVVALVTFPDTYESSGTAWVSDASSLGGLSGTAPAYSDKTASERQAEILGDLLQTRAFRLAVAAGAGLVPAGATEREAAAIADDLYGRIAAVVAGPNLVSVKASASTAEEAKLIAASVIAQYQLRALTETTRDAATILTYFQTQVAEAQAQVDASRAAVAAYVASKPSVTATPDAEYQRLLALSGVHEASLARVLQSQQDAQASAAAITASAQTIFVVQDLPVVPAAPLGVPLMKRAAYPGAGLVLGAFISAAILWLSYRTDRSIRSAEDIEELDVNVLGAIPELKPADIARRFTPLRWAGFMRRNYARKVAASISPMPGTGRGRAAS
jgi:hypothetical protein